MNYNELARKALEILKKKTEEAATFDPDGIDYRVIVEEIADCTFLLAGDFEPEAVEKVKRSTTCGELYDLLEEAGVASRKQHQVIVTVEERTLWKFPVDAASAEEAMGMARDAYNTKAIELPAGRTARFMKAKDTVTGDAIGWTHF